MENYGGHEKQKPKKEFVCYHFWSSLLYTFPGRCLQPQRCEESIFVLGGGLHSTQFHVVSTVVLMVSNQLQWDPIGLNRPGNYKTTSFWVCLVFFKDFHCFFIA